jgi:RND family efflux transporter MFP subunit
MTISRCNQKMSDTPANYPLSVFSQNALCITLSVWLYIGGFSSTQAAEPVPVRTKALSELAIFPESAASAVVMSLNNSAVASQVDALVLEIPVRVGDSVKTGATLIQLSCRDFELERTRLQAERQGIQAKMDLSQWQLKQAESLAQQQTLPEEQVQEKRSQLAVLRGDLAAHTARIESTKQQISHCTVEAPFAGIVTERLIAVGQFASRGAPVIRLLDISNPEVSAQVSSRETQALLKAESLVFEHNGEHYPLHLHAVLPTIRSETGTQEVRLDFIDRKADTGAAGRLVWRNRTLHIAAEWLVKRDEQLGVFFETDNLAHFHPLPDALNGLPAIITLPTDTRIIVSGQYNLNDNEPVKVLNQHQPGKP